MKTSLGVDLGATWLRACCAESGRALWNVKTPAAKWRGIPPVLDRLLRRKGLRRIDSLVVGGTGLGSAKDRAALKRRLAPLARNVRVLTDFEIAHLAAFGRGPGVLLVASTGSVAFARGSGGKTARAGGLGPLLGDEGSGFWLGRQALRDPVLSRKLPNPLRLARAEDPVRAVAALAPRVLILSVRLRREAAVLLAGLAREASRGLKFPKPTPLALHGSLFKCASLRAKVLEHLGSSWRVVAPRTSAEKASAGL